MSTAAEKKSEANKRAYEKRKAKLAAASASASIADAPKLPSPKYTKSIAKKTLETLEMPSPAPTPASKTPMTDAEKKAKRAEYNKRAYEKKKAGLTATKSATAAPTPAKKSVAKKSVAKKSVAKPSPSPSPAPSVFELMAPPKIITPAMIESQRARLKQKPAPFIFYGQKQKLFVRDGIRYWIKTSEDDDDDENEPREVYDYYDKTFVAYYYPWRDELHFLDDTDEQEWRWEEWNAQNEEIAKMDAMLALTPAEYAKYLKANKKKADKPPPAKKGPGRPLFTFEIKALTPAEYAKYVKAQRGKEAYERKKADKPPAERGPGRPFKPMTVGDPNDFTPEPPPKILTPVDDDEDDEEPIPVTEFDYDGVTYLKSDGDETNDQNIWGNLYNSRTHKHIGYFNEAQQLPIMSFKHLNPIIDIDDIDGVFFTFEGEFNKELLIARTPIEPYTHEVFDQVISRKVGVVTFPDDYDPTLDNLGSRGQRDYEELIFDPIYVTKRFDGKEYWLNASDEEAFHGQQVYIRDYKTKEIVVEYDIEDGTYAFYESEDELDLDTDSDDDVTLSALTKKVAGITLDPMKPPSFS